jgi:hypothetical protein
MDYRRNDEIGYMLMDWGPMRMTYLHALDKAQVAFMSSVQL